MAGLIGRAGLLALALLAGCRSEPAAAPVARPSEAAVAGPQRSIIAFGDSLIAGYGLHDPAKQAYPARLEAALRARGINARVTNAGVSGDTTADGAQRLDFALASQKQLPDLVLICLGGNDMLRGLPPTETRANLQAMLAKLRARHIRVVLLGMLAAPNLGKDYTAPFNDAFPAVARANHAALVPFFLAATIGHPEWTQADHLHPTPQGVDEIVKATVDVVAGALPAGIRPGPPTASGQGAAGAGTATGQAAAPAPARR